MGKQRAENRGNSEKISQPFFMAYFKANWLRINFKQFRVNTGNKSVFALSRLKQGFDSPRERHLIASLHCFQVLRRLFV